ncbi:MAG: polysaccharide pyruvyl transferase family protein [Hymenobacteraceae bacterium]|nr:polysaccharide pyruvyl transferase family protein [Hymenobacteraceae bacterium]
MKDALHVLIVGANFSNKGAEAMLKTVQQELETRYSNVTTYMICREYEKELAEKNNIVPVFDEASQLVKEAKNLLWRIEGKFMKVVMGKNKPFVFAFPYDTIQKKIKKLDLVIDISGFAYADSWGKPMIDETIKLIDFCKQRYKARCYFLPQAWGSFDKPEVAAAAKEMLSKADKFYARDLVSREYLATLTKDKEQDIPLLHDIAFAYEGNKNVEPEDLLQSVGYRKNGRRLVCISPNLRVYEKFEGDGADNPYVRILMALASECLQDPQTDLILVPNEIFPDGAPDSAKGNDDRLLCRMLHEMIDQQDRCFIVDGYRSAEEIKTFISQADVLISSRFHALIFGLLHAKPVMAISWSHKYKELFSIFGIEDYVLEWNTMDTASAIKLLQRLESEKDEVSTRISSTLEELRAQIDAMFTEISSDNSKSISTINSVA